MQRTRLHARWLGVTLATGLGVSCLPSQFDDLSDRREERDPATACDAGGRDCPRTELDGSATPNDADAPREAAAPPADAAPHVDAGPRDAGIVVDAGTPPPSTADWPAPTEMAAPSMPKGCVYAQYCKASVVSKGAVCRLYPMDECQIDADSRMECLEDLAVTCGVPQKPIFLCDRASKSCVIP